MALIAPRGLMLSTAKNEGASNPWGIEQAYGSAQKVYQFLMHRIIWPSDSGMVNMVPMQAILKTISISLIMFSSVLT
jgi:hypothetical protein